MPSLHWRGKDAVLNHHLDVPYHLLKCQPELSAGCPGSGNLIVEGDNLLALKALLPYYKGQVKCIYIDPPYNTGNEGWIYNDNVNSPEIRNWLGKVVGKEAEDLNRHDKWLCMMWPRLKLLREFLCQDGAIFISIDDQELHHLRFLLNEVFGEANAVACLVWEKSKKGDSKLISVTHEYVLVYAKYKAGLLADGVTWRQKKAGADEVLEHYQGLRAQLGENHEEIRLRMMKWFKSLPKDYPAKAHKHYNWSDSRGLYFADNFAGPDDGRESRPRYDIPHPVTGEPCKIPSTGWRWEEPRTLAALAEIPPRIHFGPDHTTIPCRKSYLFEIDEEPFASVFYRDGRGATLTVEAILGKGMFQFPKDAEVLASLISLVAKPGDLVLDSFAGSGTTAHAVMKLNVEDGGNRRFILVEMDPAIARDVTAERVRRVARGYANGKGEAVPGLGSDFRYCTLGAPLFRGNGSLNEDLTQDTLSRHLFFTEFGEPLSANPPSEGSLVGTFGDTALHLLWDTNGPGFLDAAALRALPAWDGEVVIYGEGCAVPASILQERRVSFRQVPYRVRG